MKQKAIIFLLIVVLLLSACQGKSTSSRDTIKVHPELKNVPVYPEASAWAEGVPGMNQVPYKYPTYSYTVKTIQYEQIVDFYEKEMPANDWELLSKSDDGKNQSAGLMYATSKTVAHIQIFPRSTGTYTVTVVFYDDPVPDE